MLVLDVGRNPLWSSHSGELLVFAIRTFGHNYTTLKWGSFFFGFACAEVETTVVTFEQGLSSLVDSKLWF